MQILIYLWESVRGVIILQRNLNQQYKQLHWKKNKNEKMVVNNIQHEEYKSTKN